MKLRRIAIVLLAFSTLAVSNAQNCLPSSKEICLSKVGIFINNLNEMVVVTLGTLFLATAIVGFFFGVVRFIWAQQQGDEKGVNNGKETLKWGLIALFCAFSVYGIIQFAQSTLFPGADLINVKLPKLIIDTTSSGQPTNNGRVNIGASGSQSPAPIGPSGTQSSVPVGNSPSTGNTPNTNPSAGIGNILNSGAGASSGNDGSFSGGSGGATFDTGVDNTTLVKPLVECPPGDASANCQ